MATYMEVGRVQYQASSGVRAPLCRLYFCRHCLKLRSSDCVSHEVDSHYCPNCLENMPSAEAKLKKNRCGNCFDCPSCCHTMSTRATSISVPHPDDPSKSVPKKVYYLACGFCRWTSRDVGMKDQPIASGGWPDQENLDSKRIGVLLDYYRQLAQREKAEKEKKKYIRRRSYLHLSKSTEGSASNEVAASVSGPFKPRALTRHDSLDLDKYGLSSVAARRRTAGMMGIGSLSLKDSEDIKIQDIPLPDTVDAFEELSDEYLTNPVTLAQVATITQRHANPEFQAVKTSDLYPRHKHMLIKRSQRCRECEHNLSKPEFNPASIKFKIQLVALHHVPEIRIMSQPNLEYQKETQVILTLLNPLDTMTHVTLHPVEEQENDWDTAKVDLPSCELLLSPRDDAAEFDDGTNQQQDFKDDPSVVVSRKSNKIGFFIKVTPQVESGDVKASFQLKYDYKNMTTALQSESKEPETMWLQHNVYLILGSISTRQEE